MFFQKGECVWLLAFMEGVFAMFIYITQNYCFLGALKTSTVLIFMLPLAYTEKMRNEALLNHS